MADPGAMINEITGMAPKVKRSDSVYRHMRDPALLRYYYKVKTISNIKSLKLQGSSPTDIFVGRYGYPYVHIGPLVPPEFGDTSILGTPELWRDISIETIVDWRSKLVRGMKLSKVTDVDGGKVQDAIQELALAERPADVNVDLIKRPFVKVDFRDEVQPFGPSAEMSGMNVSDVRTDTKIESKYSDTDATATTAMRELYDDRTDVSRIQMALSAGLLGIGRKRRFVPTRWSITAVDDSLSKYNLMDVKGYNSVDAINVFYNVALDNRWMIFFIPGSWQYESIEAWWPNTVWNEGAGDISIYGSYEGFHGRKTYAEIGGCYYAARLAVSEKMKEMKRQGIALILREVHDGYTMPVGVWNVREHVRETLEAEPKILHGTNELLDFITSRLSIRTTSWIANSRVLKELLSQRKMTEYVK